MKRKIYLKPTILVCNLGNNLICSFSYDDTDNDDVDIVFDIQDEDVVGDASDWHRNIWNE